MNTPFSIKELTKISLLFSALVGTLGAKDTALENLIPTDDVVVAREFNGKNVAYENLHTYFDFQNGVINFHMGTNVDGAMLLRWKDLPIKYKGLRVKGDGILKLTTLWGEENADTIRVWEIQKGAATWAERTVTYNYLLFGAKNMAEILGPTPISDVLKMVALETQEVVIPQEVLQRMIDGETSGLALRAANTWVNIQFVYNTSVSRFPHTLGWHPNLNFTVTDEPESSGAEAFLTSSAALGGEWYWNTAYSYFYTGFWPFIYAYEGAAWYYVYQGDTDESAGYYLYDFTNTRFGWTSPEIYPAIWWL